MGLKEYFSRDVQRFIAPFVSAKPLLFIALAFGCLMVSPPLKAQDQSVQFSETLQDFPLMPGVEELSDSLFVYDKPQGRIIYLSMNAEKISRERIQHFYEQTLPQLGWQPDESGVYSRGHENLIFDYSTLAQDGYFTVIIRPDVS